MSEEISMHDATQPPRDLTGRPIPYAHLRCPIPTRVHSPHLRGLHRAIMGRQATPMAGRADMPG